MQHNMLGRRDLAEAGMSGAGRGFPDGLRVSDIGPKGSM